MYRTYCTLLLSLCFSFWVKGQAIIKFDKTMQHLGFVHKGDTLKFEYPFKNIGNQPLVVSETKVECGCTQVGKPSQPIDPGKQGVIKISFNTSSTIDRQDRTVTILSNAYNSPSVVRFKCVVLKAKK
jgi:hypothetical protein